MSTFVVNYETLNNIFSILDNIYINQQCCWLKDEIKTLLRVQPVEYCHQSIEAQITKIGQRWLKLNLKAYFECYPKEKPSRNDVNYYKMYEYKYNRNITIYQALKSLTCLYYQCSDIKDYLTNVNLELMKKLTLKRINSSRECVLGVLELDDKEICKTLELPWRDNQKGISCIPAGEYKLSPYPSSRFGEVYIVNDVPNRTGI